MHKIALAVFCFVSVSMIAVAGDLVKQIWETKGVNLEIKGARVETGSAATDLALRLYGNKTGPAMRADENVESVRIVQLGYELPGFATKGDKLWEARVALVSGELRAIIWINPVTGEACFVAGPWDGEAPAR